MPKNTPGFFFDSIKSYYDKEVSEEQKKIVIFDITKREAFINCFVSIYNNILNKYMDDSTEHLDRHKQASILIVSAIKTNIIFSPEYTVSTDENPYPKEAVEEVNDKIFIGLERISLLAGLAYMLNELNEKLEEKGINKIDLFSFPEPFACNTKYFDVLIRSLYYYQKYASKSEDDFYVMELANTLFLIEYLTLLKNNIDVSILKDSTTNYTDKDAVSNTEKA